MNDAEFQKVMKELEALTKTLHWKVSGDLFGAYRDMNHIVDYPHGVRAWSVPKTTGEYLYNLVKEKGYTRVLEIGTSVGYSTLWIAKALELAGGHIDTLEVFDQKVAFAREYFKKANLEHIISSYHIEGETFLASNTNIYDFVFLDANKSSYVEYLKMLRPFLKKDGLIVIDNATNLSHKFSKVYEYLESVKSEGVMWHVMEMDAGLLHIENFGEADIVEKTF